MVDAEEKIRNEARKFVNKSCPELSEHERKEVEDGVVDLIKETLFEFLDSDEAKGMKDDDVLEVHLSREGLKAKATGGNGKS